MDHAYPIGMPSASSIEHTHCIDALRQAEAELAAAEALAVRCRARVARVATELAPPGPGRATNRGGSLLQTPRSGRRLSGWIADDRPLTEQERLLLLALVAR